MGTITPAGVYTAPATIASIQTVTITATSAADATRTAVATISLKPAFTPIRVNAAGSNYTDSEGRLWQADTGFTGGSAGSGGGLVWGTYDPSPYLSARTGTFSYEFTVPPGSYAVTLKFAETNIFAGPGFRRFNVAINNVPVEQNLDVFAAAGGGLRALDRTYAPVVASGVISLQFTPGSAYIPMVSAIEIVPAPTSPAQIAVTPAANLVLVPGETKQFAAAVTGTTNTRVMWTLTPAVGTISQAGLYTAPATMTEAREVKVRAVSVEDGLRFGEATMVVGPAEFVPVRLRAGATTAYTDTFGQIWSADRAFRGGTSGFTWTAAAGAADPNVYQHWRQDHFRYDFFGPAGNYLVKLRFREPGIYAGPGSRRFPIFVNDTAIEPLPGFDIFTAAGGANKSVDRQYWVTAPQGKVGIRFDYAGVSSAMVSAIEITDGLSISGQVTVGGAGLPNTTVTLSGAESRTAFTDASGFYRFRSLRPGMDYTVTASRLLYTFTSGPVVITNLQASQTANFSGILSSSNLTPAFVNFTASPTSGWFSTWTANFSDANHANDIVQGELYWGFNPGDPDRACHVRWNLMTGQASLRADSGAWLPAIDMYNPQGSRSNSTCTIHTPFSNSAAANQRGFTISVSFASRMAGEGYPISVKATDLSGASTGWVRSGGWSLPQSQ